MSEELGTAPIGSLLRKQAIPAAIGILTLSINGIVDNIFVGRYIGVSAIGAITVVLPITFLIASIGMAIGVGGGSVISRALGERRTDKARRVFGNQIVLTVGFSVFFVLLGYYIQDGVLELFGSRGDIMDHARVYFNILLPGVPFLAFVMMCNNVIRAEGAARTSMQVMVIPAVTNIILDALFIRVLGWDMAGAAWASMLSYIASASYAVSYLTLGKSSLKVSRRSLCLDRGICKEIFSIGSVTLARQGTVSLLALALNNALIGYGGEASLSIWGTINRMMMFANFPVFGVTQGFLPIAGYNYGARKWARVEQAIRQSILYGTGMASLVFLGVMCFAPRIIAIFTADAAIVNEASNALRMVFLLTPTLTLQLIGSAYYQAIGKARMAMLLALAKQGIFLIPLILTLPPHFGIWGVWMSFPIADGLTAAANYLALRRGTEKLGGAEDGKMDLEKHPMDGGT